MKTKLLIFIFITSLFSFPLIKEAQGNDLEKLALLLKSNEESIIKKFNNYQKDFSHQFCRPGTEEKFWRLFREFRGDGHYLPKTIDGRLDRKILNRFIPELKRKKKWIASQKSLVKKMKSFDQLYKNLDRLEKNVQELVKLKEAFEDEKDEKKKVSLKITSRYKLIIFKTQMFKFLGSIPFLTSYRYPNDHFELRENYDEVKLLGTRKSKSRANEVYFYRKVVQDGAQNPNQTKSDTFLRAMLDTIALSLKEKRDFITENLRYDLMSAFKGLKKQFDRGIKGQVKRLNEWYNRVGKVLDYYISLRRNKVKRGGQFETSESVVAKQAKARQGLKNFVYQKQAEVYKFWAEKDEIYQSLYVILTILFNEVGSIDSPYALERYDVTQVVLNRLTNSKYNYLARSDAIYKFLNSKRAFKASHKWLNVLFKEGEFSFTYYFIHGAVRIFCPDQSRLGKKLRGRNLGIALNMIKNPKRDFEAIRYFSRASMLGRITMDDIWSDYTPLREKPGVLIKKSEAIWKNYADRKYSYRYHFFDENNRKFKVIEIADKVYSLDLKRKEVFSYRSPHYFKYFRSK